MEWYMKRRTIVFICIVFFVGLAVLLYPTVSNYINSLNQGNAIAEYNQSVGQLSKQDYRTILEKANRYNAELLKKANRFKLSPKEQEEYNSVLNLSGDGIIGYIEIEKLGIKLSIAHGMSESVLEKGIGHMEGSSVPCGGPGTHAVLVGHRALPSAKLFTDLDQMEEGDIFTLHTLNLVLTYQVDQIKIVKPDHMGDLSIEEGKDYVTLVTCTPYAVNTHRLLVRGKRIATVKKDNALEIKKEIHNNKSFSLFETAPIVIASVLLIIFSIVVIKFIKMRK